MGTVWGLGSKGSVGWRTFLGGPRRTGAWGSEVAGLGFDPICLTPKPGFLKPAVCLLWNLFPVPKNLKYLRGFHPVLEDLVPQSLQETPEGIKERTNTYRLVFSSVGRLPSEPLGAHKDKSTQAHSLVLGSGQVMGSPPQTPSREELLRDWLLGRGPRLGSPFLVYIESEKKRMPGSAAWKYPPQT